MRGDHFSYTCGRHISYSIYFRSINNSSGESEQLPQTTIFKNGFFHSTGAVSGKWLVFLESLKTLNLEDNALLVI